ncbi:hypothetical protein E5352_15255 [Stenotrophomonas maltophilia]|uniref:Uncharacterized protein n=2 Tax=Lysobacteraceae TaxID=32033 RepID=A0A4S2CUJ2_STEMA|nr:hypothetical protein E5352_15255 [Stenotrophomonas maltophilia]
MMGEDTAPWWLAGSAVALWLVRETWGSVLSRRKERTETDANVDLLNGLVQRVKSLEDSQAAITVQLAEEMSLRRAAQEEAHKLRLRVLTLESAMRQVGAVIPPEPA